MRRQLREHTERRASKYRGKAYQLRTNDVVQPHLSLIRCPHISMGTNTGREKDSCLIRFLLYQFTGLVSDKKNLYVVLEVRYHTA
jgi:hypothetical protein